MYLYSQFIRMHLQNKIIIVNQIKCTCILKDARQYSRKTFTKYAYPRSFKLFTRTQLRPCAKSMMLLQIFVGCRAVYETA